MKKLMKKCMKYTGALAVCMAMLSVNTTCMWFIHQPEIPQSVSKLKVR